MRGIDISAWQENIDWQAIKDAGVEFVIIKLGQNCKLDSMFVEHINNAVAAGMKTGVYYYTRAQDETEAVADADWVSSQIQQYLNGQCPEMGVWYDVEDESIIDATAICKAFIDSMPYEVGIYANYDWLTNRIDTVALNVPIWCAQYDSQCNFQGAKIWQYTDSLEIAGQKFDGNEVLS